MGARNRTQQNLEVVRTDPVRGLIFIKGSVPGSKNGWVSVEDAVKLPRHDGVPYPAGLISKNQPVEEAAPAGLVDDAAVHEIPALPGDDEVAAIAAEQEAGAEAEAKADAAAEADAADAAQSADNQKADEAESDKSAPASDDGKES
jgi:large subunit ribosomal protein L3